MELIDIYDKNGRATGIVRDKKAPLGPEEYRMAVGIWIMNSGGHIFLTKRSMADNSAGLLLQMALYRPGFRCAHGCGFEQCTVPTGRDL